MLVTLVSVVSCTAFGLTLGSVGMRARDVFMSANIAYYLMWLLCGVNIPLDALPGWLAQIGRLMPLTHGIAAAREVAAGASLSSVSGLVWTEVAVGMAWGTVAFILVWLVRVRGPAARVARDVLRRLTPERADDGDADGDHDHAGHAAPAEPLPEEEGRPDRRERGELRGEHGSDRDPVPRADRVGDEAGHLGEARRRRRRAPPSGSAAAGPESERNRHEEDAEQARREDCPGDRQVEAGAAGRVEAGAERDRGRREPEERRARDRRASPHRAPQAGARRGRRRRRRDERERRPHAERLAGATAITAATAPSVDEIGATTPTFPIRKPV